MKPAEIVTCFLTEGEIGEILPHGGGHINDNYHCRNSIRGKPDYLLQKINHHVFKDVDLLMGNLSLVTKHIAGEGIQGSHDCPFRCLLQVIPTRKGNSYHRDAEGNYWRILNFIPDHIVHENTRDPDVAYEGARMFGEFIRTLSGLAPSALGESIPRFHDLRRRLTDLEKSLALDPHGRAARAGEEIRYVDSRSELMGTVQRLGEKGAIPLRVTHNDTKINNVLFDREGKGLCVVDLDTVMPGYVHYDFGDGIRTFTNTGLEDDENPDNVTMDLELYRAFCSGFLDATRSILTRTEKETLAYAGLLFPFIMGVRFLTDFIEGDIYFKTRTRDHNLVRARAQFKLAMDGEFKLEQSKSIINRLI